MSGKKRESESGQSLILIALLMVGMVGVLGLALDGGNVFGARRKSQNAADAAALAGVRLLATKSVTATEPSVWSAITKLAMANGVITATDIVASFIDKTATDICTMPLCGGIPANATGVRVKTTLHTQPYFIDIFIGKQKIPVPAVAATQSGPPAVATNLAPMSIKFPCTYDPLAGPDQQDCNFHYGSPAYRLFGEKSVNGGFQWTSYDCRSDAPDIEEFLRLLKTSGPVMADSTDTYYVNSNPTLYNFPPPSPNPWVCSGPGVEANNNIQSALDCWLFPDKSGCWLQHTPPSPYPGKSTWTVPVFDHDNGQTGQNAKYHVVMFAEFDFRGYWFGSNQCNWLGKTTEECGCTNDPAYPTFACQAKKQPITADLEECLVLGRKCIMGYFLRQVTDLQIYPGQCNRNGLDICGVGMSQ